MKGMTVNLSKNATHDLLVFLGVVLFAALFYGAIAGGFALPGSPLGVQRDYDKQYSVDYTPAPAAPQSVNA
jgi:hypothetical protein